MLEEVPERTEQIELIRLAVLANFSEFSHEQGLNEKGVDEARQFLDSRGVKTRPKDIVDSTFKPKPQLAKTRYATRFSDGSFPVLYGALEAHTAEAETQYWFSKRFVGKPTHARMTWYMRFTYHFNGIVKDLRPKQTEWPNLTHDNDYQFCNRLGTEAVATDLDGLLAPSVRNEGGTNLPVFARQAVNSFSEGEFIAITYHPKTGEMSLHEASS